MTTPRSRLVGHRPDREDLRAVAIAAVLLCDAGVPWLGGDTSVTALLVSERSSAGRVSLRSSFARRANRLHRASVTVLHDSSSAVEEQICLVWPVLLGLALGRSARRRGPVVVLTVPGVVSFISLPTRAWGFALGGLAESSIPACRVVGARRGRPRAGRVVDRGIRPWYSTSRRRSPGRPLWCRWRGGGAVRAGDAVLPSGRVSRHCSGSVAARPAAGAARPEVATGREPCGARRVGTAGRGEAAYRR